MFVCAVCCPGERSLISSSDDSLDKSLDVFISYRRSTGSQLASLLKVHLQVRRFSVFLDVERLEAGKFDNNLLQSIKQAKHFFLVLTPNALDRCIGDDDRKDWVHKVPSARLTLHSTKLCTEFKICRKKIFFCTKVTTEAFLSISQILKVTCIQGGTQTKL
jgi:hypothetical protein